VAQQSKTDAFPFGVQYLRGLTPERADWDRDMAAMRRLGFTHIRAWLVWGVLEPRPGQIDFAYLDALLASAARHNLRLLLLFHLHGCPEWAVTRHRALWYVGREGRPFEPQARANTPSGGWPGLCPDHATARALEARFITAIVRHVPANAPVAYWEPVNEPHQWVDLERDPAEPFCYCDATRRAFRRWLRTRYGTLDALGAAWGRRFAAWGDVRPPTWRFGFSDWADWRTFAADSVRDHLERRVRLIRASTRTPVIAHAWGGGSTLCPQLGGMAFDDWKNAVAVDIWGCSGFPTSPAQTAEIGLCMAATRGAAAGKPYWQAELGAGDYGIGVDRRGRVSPAWLALWSWESLRQGAKGLLYWQYRKERQGAELGAYGLVDYAGGPTANSRAVAAIGDVLRRHGSLFRNAEPEPAAVALLFSYQSYMVDWAQYRTCRRSIGALSGYFRIFWDANIPADVLHEDLVDDATLDRYRLLVLPMPVALSAHAADRLAAYVARGGHVLSDPYCCALRPDKSLDTQVPGRGLAALFGIEEDDITQPTDPVALTLANGTHGEVSGSALQAFWRVGAGAQVVARYGRGRAAPAAIVSHRHGAGWAQISGLHLGLAAAAGAATLGDDLTERAGAGHGDFASRIVLAAARDAGIRAPLQAPATVRAGLLHTPDQGSLLIACNLSPMACSGSVAAAGRTFRQAVDLADAAPLALRGGRLTLAFGPWQTRVFRLRE